MGVLLKNEIVVPRIRIYDLNNQDVYYQQIVELTTEQFNASFDAQQYVERGLLTVVQNGSATPSVTQISDVSKITFDIRAGVVSFQKLDSALQDQIASGSKKVVAAEFQLDVQGGGPLTGNVWTKYPLNTLTINDDEIATLDSNEIELPAGNYEIISGMAKIFHWWRRAIRVINVTTTDVIARSVTVYDGDDVTIISGGAGGGSGLAMLTPARFTLTETTKIRMEYIVDTAFIHFPPDTNDLGISDVGFTGFDAPYNVYGNLYLIKRN